RATTEWSPDGSLLVAIIAREAPRGPDLPPPFKWHAIDARSGALQALAAPPPPYAPPQAAFPVRLKPTTVAVKEGTATESVRPLWLESVSRSEQPRALICGDSETAQLAPNGSAALYLSQGAAWAVPFLRVPKEPFLQARRTALRVVTLSNARQIGLGL